MKRSPFLRWWIIVALSLVGFSFFGFHGGIDYVNQADVTKLSFVIFVMFLFSSVQIGYNTYKNKENVKVSKFLTRVMPKIGMVGTVIGFIIMLSTNLSNVSFQNVQSIQAVIGHMTTGMSTALVTTAAGLICSLILQLQLFNLGLEE